MIEAEIYGCITEVEVLLGRELSVTRGLADQEPSIAFEQLCDVIDDETFALDEQQLERLRTLAARLNIASAIEILAEIKPGDASRTWMTDGDLDETSPPPDLLAEAAKIRESGNLSSIKSDLGSLLGREPTTFELTRFVRMIAPEAPLNIAIKATNAVEEEDPIEVDRLLRPEGIGLRMNTTAARSLEPLHGLYFDVIGYGCQACDGAR